MFAWKEPKKLYRPKEKVVFTSEPCKVRTRQPRTRGSIKQKKPTNQPTETLSPNDNLTIDGTNKESLTLSLNFTIKSDLSSVLS